MCLHNYSYVTEKDVTNLIHFTCGHFADKRYNVITPMK